MRKEGIDSRQNPLVTQILVPQLPRFVGAVLATACATAFAFSVPLVVQSLIDSVFGSEPLPPFRWLRSLYTIAGGPSAVRDNLLAAAAVVVALTLADSACSFAAGRMSAVGAERGARALRDRLYRHLQAVSIAYHGQVSSGDLVQRCTSDVDTVRRFFAIQLAEVGRAAAMVLLAVPVLLRLNALLALVALASFPFLFFFTWRFFTAVEKAFERSDEAEGEISSMLQEHLSGIRVVRAFARERHEYRRFARRNDHYRRVTMRLLMLLARYWGVSTFTVVAQLGAVLVFGTMLATNGQITVGALLVFLMLEQLLLWPIRQLGMVLADFGKARVAAGRIAEILAVPTEDEDPALLGPGTARPPIRGLIEFRNVSFTYPAEPQPQEHEAPATNHRRAATLSDVSFTIHPGETIGLLGPTGSGKSTMMMLLARLYDPTEGVILVDGVDITTIERRWMRRHLGYVMQEPFLYARTLRDNISFARSSAADIEIFAAARSAAIHEVIEGFSRGYETAVGEKGVTLSGGQKQRVAIARALLTRSPILVFDDSLSAVDTRTDARIREALLTREATTILISHRTTTLVRCDRVLVLEGGRLVEQGSPRALIGAGGHFARNWNLQQGGLDANGPR